MFSPPPPKTIWNYTCARWDGDHAAAYVRAIQRAVELVADNPLLGRWCRLDSDVERHLD